MMRLSALFSAYRSDFLNLPGVTRRVNRAREKRASALDVVFVKAHDDAPAGGRAAEAQLRTEVGEQEHMVELPQRGAVRGTREHFIACGLPLGVHRESDQLLVGADLRNLRGTGGSGQGGKRLQPRRLC